MDQTQGAGHTDTYDAYEYDTRNRLTASCFGVSAGASNCSGPANAITYTYDKVSNRTQEVRTGNVGNTGTIDYTYNDADQLTSTTKGGQTTTYTYDSNGNQASIGSRTFTYDLANRLFSTTDSGTTTTYTYDGDDRRVSSTTTNGADLRYIWDPLAETDVAELALERTPSGSLVRRYVNGPLGAISLTNGSATFYFHQDPLQNVTDVTDASGNPQWRYEYEAFGAQRSATDVSGTAPENRLRFNNQYFDVETGAYHLRARQYDPMIGRFEAVDPIEQPRTSGAEAFYVYSSGQPTVLVDPSGELPDWLESAAREASMIVDWGVHVLGKAITTVKDIFTGETGRRLGSHLWDVYEAAGGGRNGRYAVAKTIALLAVPRPDMCIRAIYKGSGREISSECGQAALEVLPFIKACRLAREAEGAGELGSAGAAARLRYEASPKHGRVRRGRSNPAPVNGQEALDFSIPLGPNTPRRIGIDYETGEFVVFHRTREGVYHGHVRTWGELTPQMQATLRRGGLVDKRGRITIGK